MIASMAKAAPVAGATVLMLLMLALAAGQPASASGAVPLAGLWCGMTEDGGSVRLTVTDDGRFVRDIEIRTMAGSVAQSEGFDRDYAQISGGDFLWRGTRVTAAATQPGRAPITPGGPGRCVKVPCRPISAAPGGGNNNSEQTSFTISVRGTFETRDYMDGSYTGLKTVSGPRPSQSRMQGKYSAWPAAMAACP
jgi:hypothetical protein